MFTVILRELTYTLAINCHALSLPGYLSLSFPLSLLFWAVVSIFGGFVGKVLSIGWFDAVGFSLIFFFSFYFLVYLVVLHLFLLFVLTFSLTSFLSIS